MWNGFLPARALVMGKRRSVSDVEPSSHECAAPLGEGDPQAELVFVGSDASPLLVKMIEAMGLKREQVFLAPLSDCPGCNSLLEQAFKAMNPKILVALGETASRALLKSGTGERGHFHEYQGSQLMPTFHPTELTDSQAAKRETWIHLQRVAQELGLKIPPKTEKKV